MHYYTPTIMCSSSWHGNSVMRIWRSIESLVYVLVRSTDRHGVDFNKSGTCVPPSMNY